MKKKKPQDATLRNVRAAKKRTAGLELRVRELETRIEWLQEQIDVLVDEVYVPKS